MSRNPLFLSWVVVIGGLLPSASAPGAEEPKLDLAQVEDFEMNVRPVLVTKCVGCHGPDKQKGGLRLDSRTSMMQGGDSGPAIAPGAPDQSRLVEAIRYGDDLQMPPKGKLKETEINALTRWVKAGAHWPESRSESAATAPAPSSSAATTLISAQDRAFWAFRPVTVPPTPHVKDKSWPRSPIDEFVLNKLDAAGLKPVAAADKRTLIRRATFDLIGLPPTVEEVEAFLRDDSPEAFARVVDRLLASPHYGERWGRHWLDVARYGEDQAHTFEARLYPSGFRYRDWVVKSLNDDKPYDQFVMEQIAGDLLDGPNRDDRLAALGFFALGPVYYGKAVYDELDDRVDTLSRGFLGLTVACARCHDHKFDPIPQRDYYALAGIFASSQYKEYPQASAEVIAHYDQAQAAIKAKTDEIASFQRSESARLSEALISQTARYMVASWKLMNRRKVEPKLQTSDVAKAEQVEPFFLDRWVKYLWPEPAVERPYLAHWLKVVAAQDKAVDLSTDSGALAQVTEEAHRFETYLQSIVAVKKAVEAQQNASKAIGLEAKPAESVAGAGAGASLAGVDSQVFAEIGSRDGLFAIPKDRVDGLLSADAKAALKTLKSELNRLKKEAPPKYAVTHGLAEGTSIADMKLFLRGNPETPADDVPRRFLSVLSQENPTPFRQGSGRLELARAIASPANPLTARVMVNRIWEHHFGRGLVGTPSNFGHMGERPTHPELLDHLASRFIALGWSIKALHREIMGSATYQLSGQYDARNNEVDPDNHLLWKMNRRRLEVEAWRDAMLAVSGTLDPTLGGPSIALTSSENKRRTFYASISRHSLDGLLRLFDFPDPNITSDKRTVTAVPLQQLFVLNSTFMEHQAKALAARLHAVPDMSLADRIKQAFLVLYARPASEREVQWALEFLGSDETKPDGQGGGALSKWEEYAQVLLGTNEFTFVD
ncbi:Planctomycete cytochrome C [Singulisphaera sp. GP187]|uniref:PSD1 and planctomycete cytochrome C domain-containing protein n=1 Tax=Singulisphaera sp. GP187 TaxID=1882752 RepID=UPI00092A1797|nr:PSD1 and planctomycete cytochrome C domain-containing protein [Singulisphaera sp. GP187]SIO60262.1 Planctomycete cytochrome C [Singulisphaera sp. GP187]